MEIEQVDPALLVPHPQNSRKHSEKQLRQLAGAIKEFGFTQPITITGENVILAGHARREAAIELGLFTVPVVRRTDLSEAQQRALVIADNKMHDLGGWDSKGLAVELEALMAGGIDLATTGFTLETPHLAPLSSGDEDDADDPPEEPISKAGDVWHLGPHRLYVGDSRDPMINAQIMEAKPKLMVTDPPYGVNYDPAWRNEALGMKGGATGKVQNDHEANWQTVWEAFTGDMACVWHAGTHAHEVLQSLTDAGFTTAEQIIWVKGQLVIGRGHYHHIHEPMFIAHRAGKKMPAPRGPGQTTIWSISHRRNGSGHGTQKPVEAMRRPMLMFSAPGDVVYDPFMGSGTTIIAAASCGRVGIGCEIDLGYADVIGHRWETYTGGTAKLMRDGVDILAAHPQKPSALKEASL